MHLSEPKPNLNESDSDRRVFARVNAQVLLRCFDEEMKNPNPGLTLDISAQGLGFISYEGLKPDQQIKILLKLPYSEEEFVTAGTIVWCRKVDNDQFRVGVSLDKPELMMISQLLNGLAKRHG